MIRKRFNQLIGELGFGTIFGEERRSSEDRTHRPLRISTVWKFSNKDPGGFGGGRMVNNGGGGSRRKALFFI